MSGLDEAGGMQATQVNATLDAGTEVVSDFQEITFTQYVTNATRITT